MGRAEVAHVFSVDLEEYFQVNAFEGSVPREDWGHMPSRVEESTDVLLELLARHKTLGTFFTLGWIADRHPTLVRRIADQGHEIASHGWWHRRVTRCTPAEFRSEVTDSRKILEDVAGRPVYGHRAPSFSIVPGTEWAFDVLIEAGYTYDSSIFPVHRGDYGYPGASSVANRIERPAGSILEIPMATTMVSGFRLPAAGGGYLRQLPYGLTRRAFAEHSRLDRPGMFYVHPWEVDPEQPRLSVPWLTRIRHYRGLKQMLPRLERLLSEFRFTSAELAYPEVQLTGSLPPVPSQA
jgi:polysaccharide deacetylase family protein (PEP-CTERM system associated)